MRALSKWSFRLGLFLIILAIGVGFWKREELNRLWAVNSLFHADRIVANFSAMERVFLIAELPRGNGPVSDLPAGPDVALPAQTEAWIAQRAVTSLLVLRNGEIVHESYHLETAPEDRRIGWSIAKSYLSALLGVILAEGHIASLDDPVTRYVPALAGGAYDGASIREVAQMSSGVAFNEDYLDYHSDINRMGRVLALGGSMDGFAIALSETFAPPGERWAYVSIDTHVLAMVIRAATGRDIPSLMSEKIIQPLGFETTPYYLTDGQGVAFALGGLNATTRDHARFGLMIARDGRYGDRQVVPGEWIAASTRRSAPTAPGQDGYGFQWWIPVDAADGVVVARGIYGQYIYIDRNRDVVIVTTAADRAFREPGVHRGNVEMFRAIADIVG